MSSSVAARASAPPVRVLVTYGWCRSSYLAVRSLAAAGHAVFVCSSRRPAMAAWSRFSRAAAVVADPFAEPEHYAQNVGDLVARWRIDVIFPGHEDGIALRRFEDRLPTGVVLACPPLAALERAVDKAEMTLVAQRAGIAVPESAFPTSVDEAAAAADAIGYPVVVKARRSNGGKGVRLVHDADGVRRVLDGDFESLCARTTSFPFLQKYHLGQVVGGCMLSEAGEMIASFGERYLRTKDQAFGTSVYRERLDAPAIVAALARLASELAWTGIAHADFIEQPSTGRMLFLELNPRPWGAIHLAYVNGHDFIAAAVDQALGVGELRRHFDPVAGRDLRSIWLVGEAIRAVTMLRGRRWRELSAAPWTVMRSLLGAQADDFSWRDPWVLPAEAICYARGFAASRGDTNPATRGMFGE